MRSRWTTLLAAGLIGVVAAACSGSGDGESVGGAGGGGNGSEVQSDLFKPAAEPARLGAPAAEGGSFSGLDTQSAGSGGGSSASILPSIGAAIIKTGRVEIEVKAGTFQEALDDAQAIADSHGGYVLASETDGDESERGRVVIRVPSQEFEKAMSDARSLGSVKGEEVVGQDVSQEFIDLEARLRNYTAQEAVLLRLMDRAQSVTDTIRVQRELEDIQLQIERIRGRLRYLDDQTSFGTISIALREAGAVATRPGTLVKAWRNAVDVFLAVISGTIVAAGFIVPIGLMLVVAALILRWLLPGLWRRPSSEASGTTV
jgi:hypothetical protein